MTMLFPLRCLICGQIMDDLTRLRLYCSSAHRQAAYRARAYTPYPAPANPSRNCHTASGRADPPIPPPEPIPNRSRAPNRNRPAAQRPK